MRFWICVLTLVFTSMLALAEEPGHVCPSDHAANQGFKAFGTFHEVMAPTWHTAYPDKDYDALLAAGPKFDSLFKGIADIQPTMKSVSRKAAFLNHRETFAQMVKAYAAAAKAGLKDSCYVLMPELHEAFEMTASALSPYSYPQLEAAIMTSGIIVEQHIPANNMEGITGSTETLVSKLAALNEETVPAEIKDQASALAKEFQAMNLLAQKMKTSCDQKDMAAYKQQATELNAQLKAAADTYL